MKNKIQERVCSVKQDKEVIYENKRIFLEMKIYRIRVENKMVANEVRIMFI